LALRQPDRSINDLRREQLEIHELEYSALDGPENGVDVAVEAALSPMSFKGRA
jgi:hypothetical protein